MKKPAGFKVVIFVMEKTMVNHVSCVVFLVIFNGLYHHFSCFFPSFSHHPCGKSRKKKPEGIKMKW